MIRAYQTELDWRRARYDRTGITASEAASALGRGFLDPLALWRQKRGDARPERTEAERADLDRGNDLEALTLVQFARAQRIRLDPRSPGSAIGYPGPRLRMRHPKYPWLSTSPDCFGVTEHGQIIGVEAKTARQSWQWRGPDGGIPCGVEVPAWTEACVPLAPMAYVIQVYLTFAIARANGIPVVAWDLIGLMPPPEGEHIGSLAWIRFLPDPETEETLIAALAEWRQVHLIGGKPPPIDGSEAWREWLSEQTALWARPKGPKERAPARLATVEEVAKMLRLQQLGADRRVMEAEEERLKQELAASAEGYKLLGPGITGTPSVSQLKTGPSWKFTVK